MPSKNTLEFVNKKNEEETKEVFEVLLSSLIFDSNRNTKQDFKFKSFFFFVCSRLVEEVMQNDLLKSKKERLKFIKFLDKLNQQKEAIEFADANEFALKIAAERLGRKAQSAFSNVKK